MPSDASTFKYTPRSSTKEYNLFDEEYFSGADVSLSLNGEKLAQVSGLQYTISEQQKPIFGYASRTFDDIAVGNRIVVGTFKVPISNPEISTNPVGSSVVSVLPTIESLETSNPNKPSWTETIKVLVKD